MPPIVGRLAPSPTGAQHLGNARTYLIAWLLARSQGGKVRLRIEDIDSPRIKPWALEQTLEDLRWLGLDWDDEIVVQTTRMKAYRQALEVLRQAGLVFPCTCTRSDLERAASAPHAEHEGPAYPGTCSARSAQDAELLTGFAWRFRLPPRIVPFTDGFCGTVQVDLHRVGGDFVIWKNTDAPAYQLAVVVDDAAMGITQVVRGDDLVPSTPRQLLLYEALHLEEPSFFHVPLVVGTDGRRLAKRHGDTRLSSLRDAGVTAERVVGLLAWSCGWSEPNREWSARDLLKRFEMDSIPREPFVLGPEHLRAIGYPA